MIVVARSIVFAYRLNLDIILDIPTKWKDNLPTREMRELRVRGEPSSEIRF